MRPRYLTKVKLQDPLYNVPVGRASQGESGHEGSARRYAKGCRCRACYKATRAARAGRLSEKHHGTVTGYDYGCRCDPCVEARRLYGQTRRVGRPVRRAPKYG